MSGVIALELRVTDYYMVISNTQVVSVDLSLLSSDAQSSYIEFNLTVFSTGNNVLNLSGFNIDQIQVLNGESHFTIRRNIGDAKWVIQMKSSDTISRKDEYQQEMTHQRTIHTGNYYQKTEWREMETYGVQQFY